MRTVGVRDLKNRLSEYLRRVRSGEGLLITDRGEVVAELAPPGSRPSDPTVPTGLVALARRGLATLGDASAGDAATLYPALPRTRRRKRTAAELLDEERGGT
jgi:antitoxin (DNA-binding transcriptional repressor) of toxin-antitoxin stability system